MVGPVEVGLDEVEGLEQLQLAGEGVRTRARGIGLSGLTRTEGLGWRGRREGTCGDVRGRAGTCRDVPGWCVVWCLWCGAEMVPGVVEVWRPLTLMLLIMFVLSLETV